MKKLIKAGTGLPRFQYLQLCSHWWHMLSGSNYGMFCHRLPYNEIKSPHSKTASLIGKYVVSPRHSSRSRAHGRRKYIFPTISWRFYKSPFGVLYFLIIYTPFAYHTVVKSAQQVLSLVYLLVLIFLWIFRTKNTLFSYVSPQKVQSRPFPVFYIVHFSCRKKNKKQNSLLNICPPKLFPLFVHIPPFFLLLLARIYPSTLPPFSFFFLVLVTLFLAFLSNGWDFDGFRLMEGRWR